MVAAEERIIAEAIDAAKNFDSLFSEEAEALRAVVMPVEDLLDLVDPDDVGVKAAVLETVAIRATIEESFILIGCVNVN
jgi:hypothetical protein